MIDTQLSLLYVRFAAYTRFAGCARLMTTLVEAQRHVDIQPRHTCSCFATRYGMFVSQQRHVVVQLI